METNYYKNVKPIKQGQKLWDTRPMKAGVYLFTMKAGIKSLSGKITIIK